MLSFSEAQNATLDSVSSLGVETVSIDDSLGLVLAEDIVSKINVSSFRNSAMDGFAVRSESLSGCSKENPRTFQIAGAIYAGQSPLSTIPPEFAIRIMTGAPVPEQFDAVVKIEDVVCSEESVQFSAPAKVGQHTREPGEDIKKGERLFCAGQRLGVLDMGVLASIGVSEISALRKPTALICVTGDELAEPGQELQAGQIYNSNKRTIRAMIHNHCRSVTASQTISDEFESLRDALNTDTDVIITSGGVSTGDKDFVPAAAEAAGWETVFHKAAVKPGKPLYFARRGSQYLFGLPGNPLSSAVICAVFVLPALKKIAGRSDFALSPISAQLTPPEHRKAARTLIWPGRIWQEGSKTCAAFAEKTSSAALSALLNSDGLIMQRPEFPEAPHNGQVQALRWREILG